jgi:replicative DNA helicase
MTEDEVAELLLVNLAKVDYYNVMRGNATESIMSHLDNTCAQLSTYNIIIDDNTCPTPDYIRSVLTEINKQETVSCVIVDYIQLMDLPNCGNRQETVSKLSRELKAIAKEFDTTVLTMSQLNRQLEYRESTRPRLSDLRESGSLEQDAHKVLLLHRPSYYDIKLDPDAEDTGEAEIIIAKNRKGKTGVVPCAWIAEYMSFCDIPKDF